MYEFSKEELEALLEDVEYYMKSYNFKNYGPNRDLKKKLKSWILNYCEHDFVAFLEESNKPFIEKCMYCDTLKMYDL